MLPGQQGQVVQASWLAVALPALLRGHAARRVRVRVTSCGEGLVLTGGPEGIRVSLGPAEALDVDAQVVASPEVILGLATGALDLRSAGRAGATFAGDEHALMSVFAPPSTGVRRARGVSDGGGGEHG
jgi:hypothetical protein